MDKKQAAKYFQKMGGREGLAKRALLIAKEITEQGSYKRAIAGAGQLKVIAEISQKADEYWREIVTRGVTRETFYASTPNAIAPLLGSDGHLSDEHWKAEKQAGLLR